MRVVLGLVAVLAAGPALADWRATRGADITAALTDQMLTYDNGWQAFAAEGGTMYYDGSASTGYWRVQGDQYCSTWPPSKVWTCYNMQRDIDTGDLRFQGARGDVTVGRPGP